MHLYVPPIFMSAFAGSGNYALGLFKDYNILCNSRYQSFGNFARKGFSLLNSLR